MLGGKANTASLLTQNTSLTWDTAMSSWSCSCSGFFLRWWHAEESHLHFDNVPSKASAQPLFLLPPHPQAKETWKCWKGHFLLSFVKGESGIKSSYMETTLSFLSSFQVLSSPIAVHKILQIGEHALLSWTSNPAELPSAFPDQSLLLTLTNASEHAFSFPFSFVSPLRITFALSLS